MALSSATTPALPWSLILLVHLHILDYPNANGSEYDHEMFNSRIRGLRDRARIMEDVTYFLVGKMEGKGVKSILGSYPCSQPSDSLAFRTSLTRYLEQLRHQSIYHAKSSSRQLSKSQELKSPTFWWKDVVVRKSLIEESAGEKFVQAYIHLLAPPDLGCNFRFEKLLVSLSTHVLMKISGVLPSDSMIDLLHSQPKLYTRALSEHQAARQDWIKTSSLLLRQQRDLELIETRVGKQNPTHENKYSNLPTIRLSALAEVKQCRLLESGWKNEQGKVALLFLKELAGLDFVTRAGNGEHIFSSTPGSQHVHLKPSPLPVAAARHRSYLKKLRQFPLASVSHPKREANEPSRVEDTKSHAEIVLAGHMDQLKRVKQALGDALLRLKRQARELSEALNGIPPSADPISLSTSIAIWSPSVATASPINFNPQPDQNLLVKIGFEDEYRTLNPETEDDGILEIRISTIRTNTLLSYPSIPQTLPPRLPALNHTQPKSRIPQPKHISQGTTTGIASSPSQTLLTSVMSPSKSARSIGRKSVRFSTARRRTGRPSMFGAILHDDFYDEVDKLVDETHDFATEDDETDYEDASLSNASTSSTSTSTHHKTPKAKRKTPKANRIWTAGTPASKKRGDGFSAIEQGVMTATPRARMSSVALAKLFESAEPPSMEFPSFSSSGSVSQLQTSGEQEDFFSIFRSGSEDLLDVNATPMPKKPVHRPLGQTRTSDDDDENTKSGQQEEDVFCDDPPSMTLKEILLNADSSNFDLFEVNEMGEELMTGDQSFVWE
ncbi:hypothetical protein CPB83DRAFT_893403 [Crepidotus variabilis]|uniref:HAUS augmin-like complex subunit 6 N-terminal domain-containing protein n=1 Tax=Crepidotus variabilis TaxID=179855 RepID=A0A9P6EH91_9AGAR|nr:hypothetical protein CPB83DRAFT_893403 [Crepidotus variabilis]